MMREKHPIDAGVKTTKFNKISSTQNSVNDGNTDDELYSIRNGIDMIDRDFNRMRERCDIITENDVMESENDNICSINDKAQCIMGMSKHYRKNKN